MKIRHFLQRLLSHQISAVLILAFPPTVAISLLRYWGGYETSIVFGVLGGIGPVLAAYYFLYGKTSSEIYEVMTNLPAAIMETRGCFYAAAAICLWVFIQSPVEPFVQNVVIATNTLSFSLFMLLTVYWAVRIACLSPYSAVLESAARGAFMWASFQWIVGCLGDEMYKFAVADPDQAVVWGIASVVVISVANASLATRRTVAVAGVRGQHSEGSSVKGAGTHVQGVGAASDNGRHQA